MQNNNWESRTKLMLSEEQYQKLINRHVLIVGLGGVGGTVAEMLIRAGIRTLTIVDGDIINETNKNRQIIATDITIGRLKTEAWKERLLSINPMATINIISEYIKDQRMIDILDIGYDYVVDAIDTLSPKVYLIYHTYRRNMPIVSSMGAGGKFRPDLVRVSDISESNTCKLAMYIRKKLHKLGIREGIRVVYSEEVVPREFVHLTSGEINKRSMVGTISYMPAIFGCYCAAEVIQYLIR